MPDRSLIVGLDIGTSRIKAVVFDLGGRLVAGADVPTPTVTTPEGWVEYDPEALWQAGFSHVDYVAIRDAQSLEHIVSLEQPARILAAVKIGKTRLIDNMAV